MASSPHLADMDDPTGAFEAGSMPDLGMDMDMGMEDRFEIFMPAVQSLVNALGGYETIETPAGSGKHETVYRPGDSVLAVLKDLKRLWRKDDTDDERTVARCMAKAGLMRELIALLVECSDRGDWGRKVSLVACDLIAALTWPIDVQAELKEMADEPNVVTDYASLLRAQVEYKAMLLHTSRPLRCILALILPNLAKPRKDERDGQIISLGLHIVRNLLAIKDAVAEGTAVGEKEEMAILQSTLILQLDSLTYLKLFLTLASCADKAEFNGYNVLVLDILHLIFRGVKPKELVQDQDRAPMNKLAKLLDMETRQKSSKARSGMTRHSRFGTTVSVKAGDQKLVLHKQNAIVVDAGKMLDEAKKKRAVKVKKADELARHADLSPDALRVLQDFSRAFIKSCFNVFFVSILKDIRMERAKIRDTDNVRTLYLSRFFMEYLLLVREKEDKAKAEGKGKGKAPDADADELLLGYAIVMAEMDSVKWVFGRLRIALDERPPAWTELQACLNCFTQILLLIDSMSTSNDELDSEAAETLQHSIYYNGDILDTCLNVVARYKDQSVAYLDSIIHFAYVLLRMLEKYSKNKGYMYVRKKKARRAKKKAMALSEGGTKENGDMPEEYAEDEGAELPEKEGPSYAEHQFTFKAFEQRFAQEGVTNTLLAYLARFKDYEDPDQMKRVVGLMHRQVVKAQAEGLYFKVTTLHLFRQILDAKASLPQGDPTRDLTQIITFILRKFFKRVQDDPFLIVEALTPKSKGRWKAISSHESDGDNDAGGSGGPGGIGRRGPAELEFVKNKKLSWGEQMAILVGTLLRDGKEGLIRWIIDTLAIALAAREEIVLSTDGEPLLPREMEEDENAVRNLAGPSKEAMEKFARHDLDPDTDEKRAAILSNAHFRLMLKLLSFEKSEEENISEQKWYIPAYLPFSNLSTSKGALEQYLINPPELGADPKSFLRKTRRKRARPTADELEEEYDSEGNPIPAQPRPARRKKQAETQIYKSAAFIEDSDDDDDAANALFFQKERALREEMEELARKHGGGGVMRSTGTKKRKRKTKGAKQDAADAGTQDGTEGSDGHDSGGGGDVTPTKGGMPEGMDSDEEQNADGESGEDEPTQPSQNGSDPNDDASQSTTRRISVKPVRNRSASTASSRSQDTQPARTQPTKANGKARRIVESDDDSNA